MVLDAAFGYDTMWVTPGKTEQWIRGWVDISGSSVIKN